MGRNYYFLLEASLKVGKGEIILTFSLELARSLARRAVAHLNAKIKPYYFVTLKFYMYDSIAFPTKKLERK